MEKGKLNIYKMEIFMKEILKIIYLMEKVILKIK